MSENADIKWYVVHTYSGYENKVRDSLLKAVENNGMQDKIVDVRIPVEEAIEIKNNKRRTVQRKLLPSYVIVKMEMTNETFEEDDPVHHQTAEYIHRSHIETSFLENCRIDVGIYCRLIPVHCHGADSMLKACIFQEFLIHILIAWYRSFSMLRMTN